MNLRLPQIARHFLKPLGRALGRMKVATDRKYQGIWMGPPPQLLDQADLLVGDVLFCGGATDSKMGAIIRTASAGEYVHCALYVGDGKVVDVDQNGCHRKMLSEFIDTYPYVAVTRCPGNDQDRARRRKLVEFASEAQRAGVRGYDYLAAAAAPLRELADLKRAQRFRELPRSAIRPLRHSRRMFCSEFIIEAYISVGYIPRGDPFLGARRRTPSGLAEENIFELVGFMSRTGLSGVSPNDPHLAECGWALTDEGQAFLRQQEDEFEKLVQNHSLETSHELGGGMGQLSEGPPTLK